MNTSPPLLILDLGSSSVRALLFDANARLIPGAVARREHRFEAEPDGAATADAQLLRVLIEQCLDDVLQHFAAGQVRAVGVASFVGNVLGVDEQGEPTTPVYTYADVRSAEDAAALRAGWDADDVHQRTGCPIHTAYHPARLRWLRRTQPDVFAHTAQWTDFATWLYSRWFRRPVPCSPSVASWSGLLNRATLGWDTVLSGKLGLEAGQLPALADASPPVAGLSPEYAARWPLLASVPFFPAIGDGAAANVGAGAVEPTSAALTVGTTAALRVLTPEPPARVPAGLWQYRLNTTHALIGGATSEGGLVNRWMHESLQLPAPEPLETMLGGTVPDQHGLTVLPMLAGERSPGFSLHGVGTLHGVRLSTTPLEMAQALIEAVALRVGMIAEQMQGAGIAFTRILAGGGTLEHSRYWVQTLADALDHPLTLLNEDETTARGVAILLLHALDGRELGQFPPRLGETIFPRPPAVVALAAARERQAALYAQLYWDD